MDAVYGAVADFYRQATAPVSGAGAAFRRMAPVRTALAQYTGLNVRVQPMTFAANRLHAQVQQLAALPFAQKNPRTGATEPNERVISSQQADRLRRQLTATVNNLNSTTAAAERALAGESQDALARVVPDAEMQRLGVTRADDGKLRFAENIFTAAVQGGVTKLADLRGALAAIGNFTAGVARAGREVNGEIQAVAATARQQLGELSGEARRANDSSLRAQLDAMLGSVLNSPLSVFGLGSVVDVYV